MKLRNRIQECIEVWASVPFVSFCASALALIYLLRFMRWVIR